MKTVPLRSVATVLVSNVDKKSVEGELPVRLCNYTNVYYEPWLHQGLDYMAATATAEQRRAFGLRVGDTVITKDSETADDIGVAALVTETAPDFVCGYHLAILRPGPVLEPRYLQWHVASRFVQEQLGTRASGVTRYGLTYDAIRGVRLLVPRFEEQRRIADFLDDQVARLDAAMAATRGEQALLEQRALTGVHDAVTGRGHHDRTPSPLTWTPDVPAHWPVAKLSLLARMGTGHTPSRSDPELWIDTSIPWLTTNDVHRFRRDEIDALSDPALSISRAGLANSAAVLHPAGTVALSRTASAGFSVVMGRDMATSQDFVTWTCGPRLLPHYLLAVLRASRQELLGRLAMGSTHKTIYFPDLEGLRVPLPPLPEQERAVEAVQRVQQEARELRAEVGKLIDLLEERKRALITACVTGEFDISTASSCAADAGLRSIG